MNQGCSLVFLLMVASISTMVAIPILLFVT
jgi:hypothetical protein